MVSYPPEGGVFIGSAPFDFTEDHFKDLCRPYGVIKRCFIVRSLTTGQSKGYGYVLMTKEQYFVLFRLLSSLFFCRYTYVLLMSKQLSDDLHEHM